MKAKQTEYVALDEVYKAIRLWVESGENKRRDGIIYLKDRINEIEYENVRPITFCKDCSHWGGRNADDECTLLTQDGLPKFWFKTKPYGFCCNGKPKNTL